MTKKHKYELTIQFTADRPLTEHEQNCLMAYTVCQVDDPAVYNDAGEIDDAEYHTWIRNVDLAEVTPTCDVCAQPCDQEMREWCGECGNCAEHCAQEIDCAGVTA